MRDLAGPWVVAPKACGLVRIRTASERDMERLSGYFGGLSCSARYNRFMGAAGDLSRIARDGLMPARKADCFTLVAESQLHGRDIIVGEASYAFDRIGGCGEFAISVADRLRRRGLGSSLLDVLQGRAASLGHLDLFGETLRTNDEMKNLARKAGFEFTRSLDWRALRFEKKLRR